MTKDDIIRMAREGKSVVEQVHAYVSINKTDYTSEDMAKMVRDFIEAEREACAKVCDALYDESPHRIAGWQYGEAIRERGQE